MPQLSKEDATLFFSIVFGGDHHIPGKLKEFGLGWAINSNRDLSTFDYNTLTKLVVLAHDACFRVSLMQGGPGCVKIAIWKRQREGLMSERHPILEDHITRIRSSFDPAEIDRLNSQENK